MGGQPAFEPAAGFLVIDMTHILSAVARFVRRDDGQDLLEYGLLVVLIAIVALAAVTTVGTTINSVFWQPIAQNF
jgi:pilus assembly protein Flp/PilA